MRKLFLFVIATILIAPNSHAATGDCPGTQQWCSLSAWGEEGCCIPRTEHCGPNSCKTIAPITGCEGLPCENVVAWTNANDGTNRQFVCNITDDECNYRCEENYYVAEYRPTVVGSGDDPEIYSCVACPANATCEDQTAIGPNCNSGYYLQQRILSSCGALQKTRQLGHGHHVLVLSHIRMFAVPKWCVLRWGIR